MSNSDKISMVMNYLINIRCFATKISTDMSEELTKFDINRSEAFYLILLNENKDGLTMRELSNLAKVDKSLTTRIIKKLVDKEYIYKDTDNLSSRNYKIKLTHSGIKKANDVDNALVNKYDIFASKYTPEEIELMKKAFKILLDDLNEKI